MDLAQQAAIGLETLNLLGHGVCLYDADLKALHWNPRLERLGLSWPQVEGKTLEAILEPLLEDNSRLEEIGRAAREALEDGSPRMVRTVQMNFPTRRNQVYHLCFSPSTADRPQGLLIFENVSEPMRIREQFERILDSTPDGLFVIDHDRRVRMFNHASGYITGSNPEEILHQGIECAEVIRCHTEEGESFAQSLCPAKSIFRGENNNQREEMLLTNAAGQERWVETTYSPITNDRGEVEFVVGILRDVHDRKMLEERLHQSEKLASLGQLVAGIAHEIKNPLAIMLSSMDVIQNPERPEEQRHEASQFMREEIKRMDERLRSFLAFARPRDLKPQPLLLSGLIRRRVQSIDAFFPNIDINVDVYPPEPIIMGDEEQLSQVLMNLILNAGEAMDSEGVITVRVRQKGDTAVMEVEDEGPGVSPDFASQIFDPFFTTKSSGTGLGLSICYQIVLAHRGTMSISEGRNGKGANFTVRLPVAGQSDRRKKNE